MATKPGEGASMTAGEAAAYARGRAEGYAAGVLSLDELRRGDRARIAELEREVEAWKAWARPLEEANIRLNKRADDAFARIAELERERDASDEAIRRITQHGEDMQARLSLRVEELEREVAAWHRACAETSAAYRAGAEAMREAAAAFAKSRAHFVMAEMLRALPLPQEAGDE